VSDIKNQIKKSGNNKSKIVYFKPGVKTRVRFLQDMDEGMKVLFHDSYKDGINTPCQEVYDKECPYCDNESLRHRDMYIWSVYDYDSKEVKLIIGAANNCSPVPAFVNMFEAYGTLCDRDYVITRNGNGPDTSYGVVPMDKARFRNEKAKPFSETKILDILKKAFPLDDEDSDDDEDEDEAPRRKASKKPAKKTSRKQSDDYDEDDEDDDDYEEERKSSKKPTKSSKRSKVEEDDDDEDEDDESNDYEDMTPIELYKECKKRKINVEPKKSAKFYIAKLEKYDAANAEDDEDEDGDDW
jgi:hypothetical protein